ncbi:MAG: restriction endonuclease subunit S [Acidobacteriota bacterium]|nr:restriction endonuclease subunit S [Acidobacteriota bacterium]
MKTYEKYKPSGIEWIGDIPEHWGYYRLKTVFDSEQNGIWGDESQENENDVYCLRVADFDRDFDNLSTQNNTLRNIFQQDFEKRQLKPGDLLIEKSGGGEKTPIGRVGVYDWEDKKAVCSNFMARLVVNSDKAKSKFLFYFFKKLYAVRINTKSIKQTTGIQNLDTYSYFNEIICLPPITEQTAIADYLDEKTAEIDKLIANKKRLIELLKEERTAIINKAVTRGVEANAKLKPSGIDWLGDIPEHWEVKKLKYVANLKSGNSITSELIRDEGEFPVYGGNGLRGYFSSFTHEGDFVLIGRQGALCGNINYAFNKFWASEHAVVATLLNEKHQILWLGELLRMMNLNQYSQSAAQPGLAVETIKNLFVPVPPVEEQKEIVKFIEAKTNEIDLTISKIEKEIQLIKEYRTALISEVVTGKIKVV